MQLALSTPLEGMDHLEEEMITCTHLSELYPDPVLGHIDGFPKFIEKLTDYLVRQKDCGSPRRIKRISVDMKTPLSVRGKDRYQFHWIASLESCSIAEADYYVKGTGTIILAESALSAVNLISAPALVRRSDEMISSFDWTTTKSLPPIFLGFPVNRERNIYVSEKFIIAPFLWRD